MEVEHNQSPSNTSPPQNTPGGQQNHKDDSPENPETETAASTWIEFNRDDESKTYINILCTFYYFIILCLTF